MAHAISRKNSSPPSEGPARERLLAAALVLFATQPPVAVSLDAIRREAGVSVGAVYHHFVDKAALVDGLYLELLHQFQGEFLSQLRSYTSAEDAITGIVRWHMRWVSSNRAAAGLLMSHRPDQSALRDLNRVFFSEVLIWWQTHVRYGALRDLPFDVINALWLGPAQEYSRHWLAGQSKQGPSAISETLASAAWLTLKETT